MKNFFNKFSEVFLKVPILMTLIIGLCGSFLVSIIVSSFKMISFGKIFGFSLNSVFYLLFFMLFPVFIIENVIFIFINPKDHKVVKAIRKLEILGMLYSFSLYPILFLFATKAQFADWNVQLKNLEVHTPIATQSLLTVVVIALVAITGYVILRFYPLKKMPPLLAVICISALYLGITECILWWIQLSKFKSEFMIILHLVPINVIIIFLRTIRDVVYETILLKKTEETIKCTGLLKFLNHTLCWPVIAFVGAVPLLGIIIIILLVFGQEPDSIIKAWTQTADWTMSQKIPPQNIHVDEHYLCTVAAGGHRKVVKPIRTGERHGHRVVVNRQLCVANAFEQLIQERTPRFHRAVRGLYDKTGYPIAKHIHSPYLADVIYFVMKPLEWLFLAVLYMFDTKSENRIAVQYPHSKPPIIEHVK